MRSKRQRKQKDRNSLKRKHGEIQSVARVASAELQPGSETPIRADASSPVEEDSNAVLMVPKAERREKAAPEPHPAEKLSKAAKRKLKQIARERGLKIQREQVLATLAEHALPETEFALLKSSATLGQRESKRQRVARELIMQRAGLALPEDAELERRRKSSADASTSYNAVPQHFSAASAVPAGKHDTAEKDSDESFDTDEEEGPDALSPADGEEVEAEEHGAADPEQLRQAMEKARAEFNLPAADPEPQPAVAVGTCPAPSGRSRLVAVERPPEIEAARAQLPIIGMEQEIIEAVLENDVVVLSGETGCGKTTQVPQFLYEAGYGCKAFSDRSGLIGITQPRRVAAIASAQRVSAELGARLGTLVGYQVRYDRRLGEATAVKFMTDGILLREAQADFLLRRYSCLVIDEAHERSLNTDLLIGMLSRIVPLRRQMAAEGKGAPLKLVIMSATLRTEDFVANRRLFPAAPPLVHVPARQFPVTLHFCKRTELHDYVGAAFGKVSQIHRQLPPGGILVFLTGQREIEALCKRLRTSLVKQPKGAAPAATSAAAAAAGQESEQPAGGSEGGAEDTFGEDAAEAAESDAVPIEANGTAEDDFDDNNLSEEEETQLQGGEGFTPEQLAAAEQRFEEQLGVDVSKLKEQATGEPASVHVLPLYAMLPQAAQARVFAPVPAGHRLIVVATNVAETSLTIPGIRYVVDTGRAKQKLLEPGTGVAKYEVRWISKASCQQRAGRAGRTGPGHCYRLFSSAVYNDTFPQHTPPEVLNTALEGVVLVMKAMGIQKVDNFPYPTAPQAAGLKEAQQCLVALGAMDPDTGALTALGNSLSGYPISPRHARMILEVAADGKLARDVLPYAVALAAATSVETPFVSLDSIQGRDGDAESAGRERQSARAAHARLHSDGSDALSALNALVAYKAASSPAHFCMSHRLHSRNLAEMAALHKQLRRIVAQKMPEAALDVKLQQKPPAAVTNALRKAMAAGWADQVARRVRAAEYLAQQAEVSGKRRAVRYRCASLDEDVFLHPQSALHAAAPEFVTYTQLVRSAKRPYMAGITEIDGHWLVDAAAPLCSVSGHLEEPQPQYVAKHDAVMAWHDVSFGRHLWQLPRTRRLHPDPATRARVFAAALLEGGVLPSMRGLAATLVAPAASAAKLEAQGQQRVGQLVSALLRHGIDSKVSLRAAWKRNKEVLKPEFAAWLKKGQANALLAIWQQLQDESQQKAGKKRKA